MRIPILLDSPMCGLAQEQPQHFTESGHIRRHAESLVGDNDQLLAKSVSDLIDLHHFRNNLLTLHFHSRRFFSA
jgi:hypothetical protein